MAGVIGRWASHQVLDGRWQVSFRFPGTCQHSSGSTGKTTAHHASTAASHQGSTTAHLQPPPRGPLAEAAVAAAGPATSPGSSSSSRSSSSRAYVLPRLYQPCTTHQVWEQGLRPCLTPARHQPCGRGAPNSSGRLIHHLRSSSGSSSSGRLIYHLCSSSGSSSSGTVHNW